MHNAIRGATILIVVIVYTHATTLLTGKGEKSSGSTSGVEAMCFTGDSEKRRKKKINNSRYIDSMRLQICIHFAISID